MWGATVLGGYPWCKRHISTHTPRVGRNRVYTVLKNKTNFLDFNSHAPCGAQRLLETRHSMPLFYFNSHAPCGAQLCSNAQNTIIHDFNSHAPCGAQPRPNPNSVRRTYISTHTPRVGRNPIVCITVL